MVFRNIALLIVILMVVIPLVNPKTTDNFDVNQLLIRVQLKENEIIEKSVKITNHGANEIAVDAVAQGLDAIAVMNKKSIILKSGSSDDITLKIKGVSKGIFVGKIILNSDKEKKEIPVVIEVESKNVLADVSLSPSITAKMYTGSVIKVDFNLISFTEKQVSVLVNYEIRDFNNNKVFEENENVVVSKKVSFTKNFDAPKKASSYVLIAKVEYNESIGTTTYIFDAEKKESNILWALSAIIVIILILFIMLKISLKKRLVISPIKMQKIAVEQAKVQKKLDSLVEAYESEFISREAYKKSRKKLTDIIKNLNKK